MLNFFKRKPISENENEAEALVAALAGEPQHNYPFSLEKLPSGQKILEAGPEIQRQVVLAMLAWLDRDSRQPNRRNAWQQHWQVRNALYVLLKRHLPFSSGDVCQILAWSTRQTSNYSRGIQHMLKMLGNYLKAHPLDDALIQQIKSLVNAIESQRPGMQERRYVLRLREMAGDTEITLPLVKADPWADTALSYVESLENPARTAWAELLVHCMRASGSTPSQKWLATADRHIKTIGREPFHSTLLDWFPLASQPRPEPAPAYYNTYPNQAWYLESANNDILKGLVWASSQVADQAMARALSALALTAYKKIPGLGPRAGKVGNACFWALGEMTGMQGIAQLSILKLRIKGNNAQKAIANALVMASQRTGIGEDEIEELSTPEYGMQAVGLRREEFEGYIFELQVNGSEVEQVWSRVDAKRLSSVPKAVRDSHPEKLKEIKEAVNDIRKMLPAQRDRIDNLYLSQKKWPFAVWRERYIDHPLVGTIARRLVWKFGKGDRAASGVWFEGGFVEHDGRPLEWLDAETTVELWHPIYVDPEVVLAWRDWLREHEVQQPFKQAHREVYLLTEAELNTRVYSNRYAAHILRQHQFNALCAARGWKNSLRLMVDDFFPPATKILPQWNLRAEYWIEGIGDNYGTDTNATGTYLYVTTDQVRFYPLDARTNTAHAGGGGYRAVHWNDEGHADPLPLEQVPPLVFTEVMRDVDLFVGVASLGNDPNWLDGGPEVLYRDYWHSYSFGDLTESARTRKQVLETLVPRLKIASRCKLTDKFLVVTGELRTYKIHLGSGNILMEPNDQYLCIVPAQGMRKSESERVFLPFEGDQTLAIILSKAFLLADDLKISDPTITRQLKR